LITYKYQKEADKGKTERGKSTQLKKMNEFLEFFSSDNQDNLKRSSDFNSFSEIKTYK
jgi:hypothetical protein